MPAYYKNLLSGSATNVSTFLFILLIIWSLFWKGLALWKSAKNNQKYWFIAILILSTAGILDIIYIAFFQAKKK